MSASTPASFARLRVAGTTEAGPDVVRLRLDGPTALLDAHVAPGQFLLLRTAVGGPEAPFALWSAPHERRLELLVRATEPPSTELVGLPAGAALEAAGPMGRGYDLARARGRDVLFVATGTGIAPVRAALETVLREREGHGALRLVLGVRGPETWVPEADLARWAEHGVRIDVATSRAPVPGTARGRVQALLSSDPSGLTGLVVAAGQPELLDALRRLSRHAGGRPEDVLDNLAF